MKKPAVPELPITAVVDKISALTQVQRILICVLTFGVVIGVFVQFVFLPRMRAVSELNEQMSTLEQKLSTSRAKANQIDKYREEAKEADVAFARASRLLPLEREIPALLAAISASGKDAGLEFLLFQPKIEEIMEFYAEIPVEIEVTGSYHGIATFFDKVSKLFRIVNIRGLKVVPSGVGGWRNLIASCEAVTYRFLEEGEMVGEES